MIITMITPSRTQVVDINVSGVLGLVLNISTLDDSSFNFRNNSLTKVLM